MAVSVGVAIRPSFSAPHQIAVSATPRVTPPLPPPPPPRLPPSPLPPPPPLPRAGRALVLMLHPTATSQSLRGVGAGNSLCPARRVPEVSIGCFPCPYQQGEVRLTLPPKMLPQGLPAPPGSSVLEESFL